MPSLFVIQGRDQGKRFELTTSTARLGRDVRSEVRLQDTEVSRMHAELRFDDATGRATLKDMDSSNGTFVNGVPVQEVDLRTGDRVQAGSTLMVFTGQQPKAASGDDLEDVDIIAPYPKSAVQQVHDTNMLPASGDSQWLSRAKSNLQVMYRTALAVSHTLDIDQLVNRVLELIFDWFEADRGCILLVDRDRNELVPKVRMNRPGAKGDERMSISRTILDYVMQNEEGVLTSDAKADQRFDAAASIVRTGTREAICVPMQGRYGVVGIIYIDTYTPPGKMLEMGAINRFNDEHLKLMIAIGHQAALAVEDTSYYSAMVQAERLAAMGQTIAGLSHHVKNILQGIRGGSYLIEEGLNGDEPEVVRKGWRIVEKNQERISRLVLDMLTFSKDREPEVVLSDLNSVTRDIVELMSARAKETNSELRFEPSSEALLLPMDPDGINHAILNIVTNAIDACEEIAPATIVVRTIISDDEELAKVEVKDNGPGISEDDVQRVFGLFVSKKGSRGTGLGLAVSRKIVREHGGDITVSSSEGEGSTFTIQLPIGTSRGRVGTRTVSAN